MKAFNMIKLNGLKFAETESEFTESLFSDQTCVGFAKRSKRKVLLSDHQNKLIGVVNTHGVIGSARKLDNGKVWYSYGTPKLLGDLPFKNERSEARSVSVGQDQKGLIFK